MAGGHFYASPSRRAATASCRVRGAVILTIRALAPRRARFAHPDARDFVGRAAEASRTADADFHPFELHASSPSSTLVYPATRWPCR